MQLRNCRSADVICSKINNLLKHVDGFMGYEKLKSIVGLGNKLVARLKRSMKGFFAQEKPVHRQGKKECERRLRQIKRQKEKQNRQFTDYTNF